MIFVWPWMLLALVVVPLVVLWYRKLLRDRAARRARLAGLGLVAPRAATTGWRRHVPPVLLLLALVVLVTGLARPEATVPQPRREGTVILAFDVSASMAAKDLEPDRIDAAKAAARTFVLVDAEQKLSGIFTDSDLARLLEANRDAAIDGPLADVMTRNPSTVAAGSLLAAACEILSRRKLSELPVVDDHGRPLGLIDITDVVGIEPDAVQNSKSKVSSHDPLRSPHFRLLTPDS
jgi:Ca-activated chloride channel family protein